MIEEKTKRELLTKLALGHISRRDFVMGIPSEFRYDSKFANDFLRNGRERANALDVQFGLALARSSTDDIRYDVDTSLLCALLSDDWHFSHEDIAFFLGELRDPAAVECLRDTAQRRFEYLDYDETFQLSRKSIFALRSIGTAEAIQALEYLAEYETEPINSYAIEALQYLKAQNS